MNANMTGFIWILHICALDESITIIGRVKCEAQQADISERPLLRTFVYVLIHIKVTKS